MDNRHLKKIINLTEKYPHLTGTLDEKNAPAELAQFFGKVIYSFVFASSQSLSISARVISLKLLPFIRVSPSR